MQEIVQKRVEFLANIAIIAVSLLLGFTLIRDNISKRVPPSNKSGAGLDFRRGPEVGQKVSFPAVDLTKSKQTLLLVLSKGCRFCSESAPFYQSVVRENAGRKDLRLVAVFPQDVGTASAYLSELQGTDH